jgi:hypothetical protein
MSPRVAGVAIAVLLATSVSGTLADSAPDRPDNTAEFQLGGSVLIRVCKSKERTAGHSIPIEVEIEQGVTQGPFWDTTL